MLVCVFSGEEIHHTYYAILKIATFSQYLHVKVKDFVKHLAGIIAAYVQVCMGVPRRFKSV